MEVQISKQSKVWVNHLQELNNFSQAVCQSAEEMDSKLDICGDEMKPFLDAVEQMQSAILGLLGRSIKENLYSLTITQI